MSDDTSTAAAPTNEECRQALRRAIAAGVRRAEKDLTKGCQIGDATALLDVCARAVAMLGGS